LQESGERVAAPEMKAEGGEALVEAPDDVEDEHAIADVFAEVAEVLCHALVAPAVL
jgi:hypothetical protein